MGKTNDDLVGKASRGVASSSSRNTDVQQLMAQLTKAKLVRTSRSPKNKSGNIRTRKAKKVKSPSRISASSPTHSEQVIEPMDLNTKDPYTQFFEQHTHAAYQVFIQNVTNTFEHVKVNMEQDQENKQTAMAEAECQAQEKLKNKIGRLEQSLSKSKTSEKQSQMILLKMGQKLATQREHMRHFWTSSTSVRTIFAGWKAQWMFSRKEKRMRDENEKHHHKQIIRQALSLWRTHVLNAVRSRLQTDFDTRLKHESQQIVDEYENHLVQLRQELEIKTNKMDQYQEQCARLEEGMRRVFLKGVSAMNLEALSVFQGHYETSPGIDRRPAHNNLSFAASNVPKPLVIPDHMNSS